MEVMIAVQNNILLRPNYYSTYFAYVNASLTSELSLGYPVSPPKRLSVSFSFAVNTNSGNVCMGQFLICVCFYYFILVGIVVTDLARRQKLSTSGLITYLANGFDVFSTSKRIGSVIQPALSIFLLTILTKVL